MKDQMKHCLFAIVSMVILITGTAFGQSNKPIVRLARIEVDPAQLEAYKGFLKEEIETSIRIEPGVISLNAVFDNKYPTHITIMETYADTAAYQAHLKRPHFLKYKTAVKDMVKKLELVEVTPIVSPVAVMNISEQVKQNIAADNIFLKVFETGDVSKLDGIIDPEFYNHTGNHKGLDTLKSSITSFHERMKTVKLELIRQLADDEYVFDWIRYTGSDSAMKIEGLEVTKYKNGKAIEHWFFPGGSIRKVQ
jgi:quinol monooxygenase YgiN/predicted SnoaL-like aldol condensation-catalyzing enzyme